MNRRAIKFWLLTNVALPPALWLLALLKATWKLEHATPGHWESFLSKDDGVLAALAHGQSAMTLPLLAEALKRGRPVIGLTSSSRDGLLIDRVLKFFGATTVKGSSRSRAASGLRGAAFAASAGAITVITVDGPRGPRLVAKPGVLAIAKLSGASIFCLAIRPSRGLTLRRAWDFFQIPAPFATLRVWVHPFDFQPDESDEQRLQRFQSEYLENHHLAASAQLEGTEF